MHYLFFAIILALSPTLCGAQNASRFEKTQAVLEHLNIADDHSYGNELTPWDGSQTRQGFETILKYMDPGHALARYLRWNNSKLTVYLDSDTRKAIDYSINLKPNGSPKDADGLLAAMRAAALNSSIQPLQGLRIALDPGHMGGKFWDQRTGKFVRTALGTVSEGVIALQTCLLLQQELTALGADVMMTRRDTVPVSEAALATYEIAPWGDREIRNEVNAPWFIRLLDSAPLGPKLFALFDGSAQLKKLRGEAMRDTYFISRLDLLARAQKINAFRPHLTLVVHFDASKLDKTQDGANSVRAYTAGNLLAAETGSRELRFQAVRNLLDGHRWIESNVFSAAIVKHVSEATKVKIETSPTDYMAIRVADGVYARNLALNRLVTQGVMSYLEVLHYDYTPEFRRLIIKDRHTEIGGVRLDYSSRLDEIVDGLKRGILDYVQSMAKQPLARL